MSNLNRENFKHSLSREEANKWWDGMVPELIIIATSSARKAAAIFWWLNDFDRTQTHKFIPDGDYNQDDPLELQAAIESSIRNGDGALNEEHLLGYIRGVPVFVCPQSGETGGNNPSEQSQNKINSLKIDERFAEKDAVFIASDTVGSVGREEKNFGKPHNMEGFPKEGTPQEQGEFIDENLRWGEFWDENGEVVSVRHSNVLIIERPNKRQRTEQMTEILGQIPHDRIFLKQLKIYSESGLGGINQSLINWTASIPEQISDLELKKFLESIGDEPDLQKLYAIFHYMGVPVWSFLTSLKKLAENTEQ